MGHFGLDPVRAHPDHLSTAPVPVPQLQLQQAQEHVSVWKLAISQDWWLCHESSIVASAAGSIGAGPESVNGRQRAIQLLVSTSSNECYPLGGAVACAR